MAERETVQGKHYLEAGLAYGLLTLAGWLPPVTAGKIFARLAKAVGGLLRGRNRVAERNLSQHLPALSSGQRADIIDQMWAHFACVIVELVHLRKLRADGAAPPRYRIEGAEHLQAIRQSGKGALFFTGHLGAWEVLPLALQQLDMPVNLVYRRANNPLVDRLIQHLRSPSRSGQIAKGPSGAREIVRQIKAGKYVGMLVDQKMNDGIAVPFFNAPAMTAPAIAQLAGRYDVPIIPARARRLGMMDIVVEFFPPMPQRRDANGKMDELAMMTDINGVLEGWIRAQPGEWLWLHRRWPKDV